MTFKQLIRFTNDAAGLEKVLRLLQSLSQILAAYALTAEDAKLWWILRGQFALGRRYFRFFKWLDCFSKAYEAFYGSSGIVGVLEVGKWTCMGAYLLMESATILDIMGVFATTWAGTCLVEGNKFWFYSLCCSILLGALKLSGDGGARDEKAGGKGEGEKKRNGIKRRMVVDGFDLFIPGMVTGWIVTTSVFVGFAGVMSTLLSSRDIWDRLQK